MPATFSNAQVDTLAAAVPSPYGPFTRVTDFESAGVPVPNGAIRGQFTSALSEAVYFTPEELGNLDLVLKRDQENHGYTSVVSAMIVNISALNTLAGTMSTPHTYDDYQALIEMIRSFNWTHNVLGP